LNILILMLEVVMLVRKHQYGVMICIYFRK